MVLRQFVNRIKQSKDGKVLVSNFAYLSLLQIAGYVFPLLTIPYLARTIGADGFGKIAFAAAIMVWIQTIADWGFNYTATRDVAKNRENIEIVSSIFSNVLWSRCILMLFSFVILLLLIFLIPQFRQSADIILVTFLMIPGHILFPDWFFQAMEKMKYITILNLLSKALFTMAVFVFIKEERDYILQPLFVSFGFIISGVISFYYIIIKWHIKLYRPNILNSFVTIKNSTDVFINNLMPNLFSNFSVILLGFCSPNKLENGKFDAGSKFVTIATQFVQVLSRTFFPFLSRKNEKFCVYKKINICVSLMLTLFFFVSAHFIIDFFYTEEFEKSVLILKIMSFSVFFYTLSNVYGTNYMIIRGYERKLRTITVISSIIGFIIAFPLIFLYKSIGAALTICISRGILGFSIMFYVEKYLK